MGKRKEEDEVFLRKKKKKQKKSMISVDVKGTVYPVNLKLPGKRLKKHIKKESVNEKF